MFIHPIQLPSSSDDLAHAKHSYSTILCPLGLGLVQSGSLHGTFVEACTFRTTVPEPVDLIRPSGPHIHKRNSTVQGSTLSPTKGTVHNSTPTKKGSKGARTNPHQQPGENESLVDFFGKQLAAKGYSYYGTETMYSGVYGTEMDCHIYMGVVYYQRLRHMVSDKFQVRDARCSSPVTVSPSFMYHYTVTIQLPTCSRYEKRVASVLWHDTFPSCRCGRPAQ